MRVDSPNSAEDVGSYAGMEREHDSDEMNEAALVIIIPVFDDWDVVEELLPLVDAQLGSAQRRARIVLVDDGSTHACPEVLSCGTMPAIEQVEVLSLRRNLGHQRALAVGLSYIERELACRAVLVMDGDGEDAPSDVPRLIERMEELGSTQIIFAERIRRSEGFCFTFFYKAYRLAHLILTGIHVRVGNFSIIPRQQLKRLVVVSNLWSHYAAAVHEAQIPFACVPTNRAARLKGQSKMSFVSLVTHGLSAIAVFGPRIGVRMLIATSVLAGLTVLVLIAVVLLRTTTDLAIPGWTTYTVGLLVVILLQMMMFSTIFVFLILASRNASGFLPIRDYRFFIDDSKVVPTK